MMATKAEKNFEKALLELAGRAAIDRAMQSQ
jgi:GTP:adenosylcobinamide-phosphate guanylyltransferase